MAARGEAQADVEVSTLVVPAWRLRWRAPELALVLGERAVALASTRRDEIDRLRAESLVVFASNRMGRGVRIADRALDALRAAEKAGEQETSWRLRVELAACATAVGAPLTGFGAVRPVLAAEGVPHALRAAALVQAGDCLITIGRGPQLGMALSEADQLYVADTSLDADTRLLQRGLLHASAAAQHRRWGDLQAATDAAGKGLELLAELADPSVDSGQVRARLTLELVCALMDSNRLGEASEIGSPLLDLPVRAPSASDVGWLRLALATRVHLPAGRVDLARGMLRDAADSAQRHQLDTLLAESLLALAHVHEVSGDLAEALTDLRSAHAAERRRARAVYAVRARLAAEFSGAHRQPVSPHEQLGSLLRPGDGRTPSAQGAMRGSQPPADAVLAPELKQQLRQWRPVQAPKQEGPRVKRALRAAEDMTVEGISAARAHAADRWRLVQPFGAATPDPAAEAAPAGGRRRAEDRESTPTDPSATSPSPDETGVSATGLIAAAGAMRSGRRRAAREAAEGDTTPVRQPEPSAPTAPWAAAQAAPEPTPEPEAPDATPEVANVLDNLKAQGLLNKPRSGGRRRAPDAEDDAAQPDAAQPVADQPAAAEPPRPEEPPKSAPEPAKETPKWRVEPPKRLRSEEEKPRSPLSALFDAPTTVQPAVRADGLLPEFPATGIGAAFPKGPAIPTARTPQAPPSPPEPPRSTRQPASADPTPPPGGHPTGFPHVGPDFRLGADSLGRSGFRPAADPAHQAPNAPQAFPATPPDQQSTQPPATTPNQGSSTDFHLSASSFGRDGFRTGTPADPDPTTPQNWPPTGQNQGTPPQTGQPTSANPTGQPDWAAHNGPDTGHQPHTAVGPDSPPGFDAGGHGWAAGNEPSGSDAGRQRHAGPAQDSPLGFDAGRQDAGRGQAGSGPSDTGHQPHPGIGEASGADTGQARGTGRGMPPPSPGWAGGSALAGSDADLQAGSPSGWGAGTGQGSMPGWAAGSSGSAAAPQPVTGFGEGSPSAVWAAGGASSTDASGRPGPGSGSQPDWRTSGPAGQDQDLQQTPSRGPDTGLPTQSDDGSGTRTPDWTAGGPNEGGRSDSDLGHQPGWGASGPSGPEAGRQPNHGLHSDSTGQTPADGRSGPTAAPEGSGSPAEDRGRGSDGLGGSPGWAPSGPDSVSTGYGANPAHSAQPNQGPGSSPDFGNSPDWAATPGPDAHGLGLGNSPDWAATPGSDARSEGGRAGQDHGPGLGNSPDWAATPGSDAQSGGRAGQDHGPGLGDSPDWTATPGPDARPGSGADRDLGDSQGWSPAGGPSEASSAPGGPADWPFEPSPGWDSAHPSSETSGYPSAGHAADFDLPRPPAHDELTVPQPPPDPTPAPDHEPDQAPPVPEPDQIPIPDPDPIPQPAPIPMPPTSSGFDLGRSRFLTSADMEDDLPELPRRVPAEAPPVVDEDPDPFVTAVVVGDRAIEVPSAARASRRHKSDLSLAELLTEALVAYETGRRSDPGADQTASEEIADWMSSAEPPAAPISPDRLERAGHHVAEPEPEPTPEPGPKPKAEPTDSEKTTYLTPVRDLESTGPIWETGPDGESRPPYDSWTLPES